MNDMKRSATPRTVTLTEGEATEAAARIALMDDCVLRNETINVPGLVRQRVAIVGGGKSLTSAALQALMHEPIKGCQGFDVISVDEAAHVNKAGTSAAYVDPFGRDRNGLTASARERAAWNDAVDQRKAERKQRRRVEKMRSRIGKLVPAWARKGGAQ